jgi:hypothetical protein
MTDGKIVQMYDVEMDETVYFGNGKRKFTVLIAEALYPDNLILMHVEAETPEMAQIEAACELYMEQRGEPWTAEDYQEDPLDFDAYLFHGCLWGFCEWVGDFYKAG